VRNARAARDGGPYLELRYEDLLADTPAWLEKALAFCGVEATRAWCEGTSERFRIGDMRADGRRAYDAIVVGGEVAARLGDALAFPEGFFREGRAGGWREAWGSWERAEFDRVAGDLLVDLGYEPDRSWAAPADGSARATIAARRALAAAARLTRRRLGPAGRGWGR
jgi:hypothetical protein